MIINNLITEIKDVSPKIIAIDGRCASGKTTLAQNLSDLLDADVVHMDDFFLRPCQRTKERYEESGGNVDYERFDDEVLQPLVNGKDISYHPFDCSTMKIKNEAILINRNKTIIIEGSYSLRKEFIKYYDFKIFMDVDKEKQLERIKKRNPDKIEQFIKLWIPYEEKYFDTYNVRNIVNIIIDTSEEF